MIHITDMYLHTLLQLRMESTDGPPKPCVYISRISTYYVNYVCTYIRTYVRTWTGVSEVIIKWCGHTHYNVKILPKNPLERTSGK